ncbi:MAG TPA: hypothetical protein PLM24_01875 [Methanothrix sp.]|nr:hypothetical protein [Methanothrix sp.]HPJ83733.1 hypothetical protein [Methanothrix sp.]HPR65868.1 hypothetical protein [Methanothrix sp.]
MKLFGIIAALAIVMAMPLQAAGVIACDGDCDDNMTVNEQEYISLTGPDAVSPASYAYQWVVQECNGTWVDLGTGYTGSLDDFSFTLPDRDVDTNYRVVLYVADTRDPTYSGGIMAASCKDDAILCLLAKASDCDLCHDAFCILDASDGEEGSGETLVCADKLSYEKPADSDTYARWTIYNSTNTAVLGTPTTTNPYYPAWNTLPAGRYTLKQEILNGDDVVIYTCTSAEIEIGTWPYQGVDIVPQPTASITVV